MHVNVRYLQYADILALPRRAQKISRDREAGWPLCGICLWHPLQTVRRKHHASTGYAPVARRSRHSSGLQALVQDKANLSPGLASAKMSRKARTPQATEPTRKSRQAIHLRLTHEMLRCQPKFRESLIQLGAFWRAHTQVFQRQSTSPFSTQPPASLPARPVSSPTCSSPPA